jgi:hypothetical protein|tara:strand:+ start:916 stop:1137 length:222 start_codon:yes stop_codon:yes gene_type:complete
VFAFQQLHYCPHQLLGAVRDAHARRRYFRHQNQVQLFPQVFKKHRHASARPETNPPVASRDLPLVVNLDFAPE